MSTVGRMVQIGHYSRRKLHLAKNLLLRDLVRLGLFSSSEEIEADVTKHEEWEAELNANIMIAQAQLEKAEAALDKFKEEQ